MSLLTFSLIMNAYLLMGIFLFSVSKSDAVQSRIVHDRRAHVYWLFIICTIVLWPLKPLVHYVIRERVMSVFQ